MLFREVEEWEFRSDTVEAKGVSFTAECRYR